MKRNLLVTTVGAAVLFLLQVLANFNADIFTNVPWGLSLTIWAVILMVIGSLAYYFMVGTIVTKFALISFAVVLANGVIEVVFGSGPAYPYIELWLIVPYVIACWVGAVLSAVVVKLRSKQVESNKPG